MKKKKREKKKKKGKWNIMYESNENEEKQNEFQV